MNYLTLLFIIILSWACTAQGELPRVKIIVPEHVLMNDDIHGQCVSGKRHPRIRIDGSDRNDGCNFHVERKGRVVEKGSKTIYCTDFVIKNVTETCNYSCMSGVKTDTKTVVVTDAMILPTPTNITTFEGMPIKLNCTVRSNEHSKYKLIWMKGDTFITDNGYTVEYTRFDSSMDTQDHYLTIHKASPGAYTCMLISTGGKVIDTKTQHVITKSSLTVPLLLKDLEQFFKWN